jgi:hypothetical protein
MSGNATNQELAPADSPNAMFRRDQAWSVSYFNERGIAINEGTRGAAQRNLWKGRRDSGLCFYKTVRNKSSSC